MYLNRSATETPNVTFLNALVAHRCGDSVSSHVGTSRVACAYKRGKAQLHYQLLQGILFVRRILQV